LNEILTLSVQIMKICVSPFMFIQQGLIMEIHVYTVAIL